MATTPLTIDDIDWTTLRANAMAHKGWKKKNSGDWDNKSRSFSRRNRHNSYVKLFLSHLATDPSTTALDIGSGPGTLAIPLAARVASVTAMDFSAGMLSALNERAAEVGISNIRTVQCAWEDDWEAQGIVPHDIAIASRSMGVEDLEAALLKINHFARKAVYISDRIGPTPFEEKAFEAIGRPFRPGPDYIYTINILYKLGIHPNLTVLELDREATYQSMDEAFASFSWMFQDLSTEEENLLRDYIESRITTKNTTGIVVKRQTPVRWALIWWKK
jgi:SAM-dependent methyltransferase